MTQGGTFAAAGQRANNAPLFSIVTSVANGAATMEKAIRSVLDQTFKNFEYLVIDAASHDGTTDILRRYDDQIDYWCSEPDSGIYAAWNKALRQARGQWIAFLGCDDQYYPDALLEYSRLLADHTDGTLHFVSSRVDLISKGKRLPTIGRAWRWPEFSKSMTVAHVGSLHHRSMFAEYGEFDDSFRICGDYELLLRPRGSLRAAFLPKSTVMMTYGGVSNMSTRLALREARRAKEISGGRARWLCGIEYLWARIKAVARGLVR